MSALSMQVKDLSTSLAILQEEKAALEQKVKAEESEKEELQKRLTALEEEKKAIETKLAEMEGEKDEAEEEKETEETAKAAALAELAAAQVEVAKLKAMLERGKTPVSEGEGKPTGSTGSGNTMSRADFGKLAPLAQNAFFRNGGKITE
jgi:chromosome segregation ATPase